jgi:hypothetical protein
MDKVALAIEDLQESLTRQGWKVIVQPDSLFGKQTFQNGHVSIGKYRQGENTVEIIYDARVEGMHTSETRVRLLWDIEKNVLFRAKGSSRTTIDYEADISDVVTERFRREMVTEWKAISQKTKSMLRQITLHKTEASQKPVIDIASLRGKRAGKKFNF